MNRSGKVAAHETGIRGRSWPLRFSGLVTRGCVGSDPFPQQPIHTKVGRTAQIPQSKIAMTEADNALFVEAEIKEHHAALIRQIVVIGIIICVLLILVGLHH